MLPVLRDAAIDSPTDENVSAYFYAQRIMFDKAQVFSDKAQQVVNRDPLLDEDLRLPFAAAAKVATLASASDKKRELVDSLADKVGLWVFYDDTCVYCDAQIEPINRLASKHGLTVHVIHKQGGSLPDLLPSIEVKPDKGQFDNLDVRFTPTVMMVVPPDGFYKISQGFASYSELVDKLVAAGNEYGLISRDEFYVASPMSKGILDVSHVEDDEQVDWNNPGEWVPFIRGEMAKTYGIGAPQEDGEQYE
jgi:conjugal transfer pilus assembly protein TraF